MMNTFMMVLLSACVGFFLGVLFMAMFAASGIEDERADLDREKEDA